MPSTVPALLAQHLAGETTTLCSLWTIVREDGTTYYFTDHDQDIRYGGNLYLTGVGYNRSAIEDKHDFSVDNMDVRGILDSARISREDVRAGRFDGASVTITIINYADPAAGGIVKRKGWFGTVTQNNRGEFDVELRGLAEALQAQFTSAYTPACRVDLGSTKCGIPLSGTPTAWNDETRYTVGQWISVPGASLIFQCTTSGITNALSDFNAAPYIVATQGTTITDGTAVFTAQLPWAYPFSVVGVTDRRLFEISVNCARLGTDAQFFDGGLVTFTTGENAQISREVGDFTPNSSNDGTVRLYLRMPYTITVGDLGTIYPGCDKNLSTCKSRFANVVNFRGFPHLPGDKYLKNYPDSK